MKTNSAISSDDSSIPLSAIAVEITNFINPYFIRIHELKNYALKSNLISKKLQLYAQNNIEVENNANELYNLGDTLIVFNRINQDVPAWWCRGILGRINDARTKYNVFLPDYGIALELPQSDFRKIPEDTIPDEYLTFTIGLNDIVPASLVKKNKFKDKTIVSIVEEWTESAILCTRELIGASEKMYFEPLTRDENRKYYGELYLIIEDEIVILSNALILSLFAVHLDDALLSMISKSDFSSNQPVKKIGNNLLIISGFNNFYKSGPQAKDVDLQSSSSTTKSEAEEERQDGDFSNFINKNKSYKKLHKKDDQEILIRSKYKCRFIRSITDARFPLHIHKALEAQNVTRPKKIQSYMWPAVSKGLDVIAISPADSGKTYGYLLPIVSYLAIQEKIPKGTVPVTLILCSSSSNATNIASLCEEFLIEYPHINIVAALNGRTEQSLLAQIYNGCQVLVSTVPFLARFLTKFKNNNIIDLLNLRHIILDGADIILDKYMESAMEIFIKHKVMREKEVRYDNDLSLQVIAIGQQWTMGLSQFMDKSLFYPYVCIGSYLEAAAFSQVNAKLSLVDYQQKNGQILEVLNKHQDIITEKIMIVCTKMEDAVELNNFLQLNNKKTILAHSNMVFNEVLGVKEDWNASVSGMYPIIVCTDDVLSDLDIKDVNWLIHHSVNLSSRSRFYYRFSTFMDNWHSGRNRCEALIMVDDSNDIQFQGLVEIMQRLHAPMPETWIKAANDIAVTLDRKNKAYPICDNIKTLGFCPKKTNCPYRHCILKDVDTPVTDLSIGDTIELMVTYIHNATHFSARLVKCYQKNQQSVINYPYDQSMNFSTRLQKYYAIVDNRRGLKTVEVGDICAIEDTVDHYKRVQILNIISRNNYDEPSAVSVRCIDDGSVIMKVLTNNLIYIPENLAKCQTNIIEVFISGIEPYDNEYEWDYYANKAVESWFKEFYDPNSFVIGKVDLHLGNSVWVDTLDIRSKVIGYPEFTISSLRASLIENNHGKENKKHLPYLYHLCENGGITDLEFDNIFFSDNEQVD